MSKSKSYAIKAENRDGAGKGIARALRRENKVPAVIYGDKKEPITIALPAKELALEYQKGHMFTMLCDLDVDGTAHNVLARDIQLHPVTDNVLHVDFLRVTAKTKLNVMVPVALVNEEECLGLKERGIINMIRHDVELLCSATAIPDSIEVDMAEVKIGDSVKMSDIKCPEGTTPSITDRDFTILAIVAPKTIEEEEAEAAEAAEGAEGEEGETAEGEEAAEGGEEAASEE